jgi:hypothetical protein
MQIVLDIKEDKLDIFLTIIQNLKNGLVESINIPDNYMDIEPIEKDSEDFEELQEIKAKNNTKYSLNDAKDILGL